MLQMPPKMFGNAPVILRIMANAKVTMYICEFSSEMKAARKRSKWESFALSKNAYKTAA